MTKTVVRRLRDTDPEYLTKYRNYGIHWVVFLPPDGEAQLFSSWEVAIRWASQEHDA